MAEAAAPHTSTAAAGNASANPFLQVVLHPDGTITRPPLPTAPPSFKGGSSSSSANHILSSDVPVNPTKNTYIRLYHPSISTSSSSSNLPLVIFFHGGGFILFRPDFILYQHFCERLAAGIPAVVASVDYSLAPESPLPAAYEDAAEALEYLHSVAAAPLGQDHPLGRVDFSKCFLVGSSSGANIAYHTALGRCRHREQEERTLRVAGLALHQPFLGGEERTGSELAGKDDGMLPLRVTDMMWHLALPRGSNRDHAFCNPMKNIAASTGAADVLAGLPRCLVTGNVGDPLIDRQRKFVHMLESAGVEVKARLDGTGGHAGEMLDAKIAESLIRELRAFVHGSG